MKQSSLSTEAKIRSSGATHVFAKIMEWCYADAAAKGGWAEESRYYPGLHLHGVAFMDDGILWQR